MKLTYKIGSSIATAGLIASLIAPATFAGSVDIIGNGAGSDNTVTITNICTSTLVQKNKTNVKTNVTVSASTGGNTANDNTGSGVLVDTGDANATLEVTIGRSTNEAVMPDCCECATPPADVTIKNNGTNTTNTVGETNVNTTSAKQKNKTKVKTRAKVKAKTGKNTANSNTGGDVDVKTGEASSSATVTVDQSSNTL